MSAGGPISSGARLENGAFGEIVREANREFGANVDEARAFRRLNHELGARAQRARFSRALERGFLYAAGAASAAAALVFLTSREHDRAAELPALVAEPLRPSRIAPPPPPSAAPPADPARADPAVPARALASATRSANEPAPASLARARARRSGTAIDGVAPVQTTDTRAPIAPPARQPAEAPEPRAAGPDCMQLARQGSIDTAERCFVERAQGSGLAAEMALYEVARLRLDVLADAKSALAALHEYRRRFPNGSLRLEADMSYLELLVQLGQSQEALRESDALLRSGKGRERAAELYVLRGNVFRRQLSDLRAAEREYAQAEAASGSASVEALYLRGLCLEGLGDREGAVAVYQRYLSKPGRPRSDEVGHRLELLSKP